jgi:two-component system nitrogen regulation response regulator GlnG
MEKLLIIDDDREILQCFFYAFPQHQYEVHTAETASAALELFRQHAFDVVIADIRLPDCSGLELLEQLHKQDARVPVILMTGAGSSNTAIEAIRRGAYHYIVKPFDLDELQLVVSRALQASRTMRTQVLLNLDEDKSTDSCDLLVGKCAAMQEVYRQIGRVAGQDVTVLILGESGTGKEVVARAIYQYSKRAPRPYLAINCAAIPESLLESELFGHEKGSFTGAGRMRIGKFEQCDNGTLFLDEIGDMTALTQTKVLRVLQDQQFERVGGADPVRTNVRLIAATNRDLSKMMQAGTFRCDLYYRLNVYTIHLPPLRERNGDLPLLIEYFVKRFSLELGKVIQSVSPQVTRLLNQYGWPGNIRELQSVIKHAIIEATGPVLLPEFLPDSICRATPSPVNHFHDPLEAETFSDDQLVRFIRERIHLGTESLYDDVVQSIERTMFTELMHQMDGNLSRAAAILGISRSTLRSKLATLGITLDRTVHIAS